MPGRTVTEIEHRYGRRGDEVLDRLRAVREAAGRIEPADVDRIAAELGLPRAHVNGAASFYADLGFEPRGRRHVRVCAGTACFAATGGDGHRETAGALKLEGDGGEGRPEVSVEPVQCLGYCYGGPAALDGESPRAGHDLVDQLTGDAPPSDPEIPFRSALDDPVVLAGLLGADPDPWTPWREVLAAGDRARVQHEVLVSGLRGRGGAGFPAAVKWKSASESPSEGDRYLISNGDEGDPGSFVDRLLMESDPDRVLAGMALAAHACGANRGLAYVRSEYPRARESLRAAIAAARERGDLGSDVHGSGVEFDVEVFEGAGSYVAGEETALIHSVEGLRGEVWARPPYPTERGLLHAPTVVNNVETLSAVPWIVAHGGDAYARLGSGESAGTKVVCLNERFTRPGAYEVELGASVRWIVDELGGGVRDRHELRALQVGGPLGGFLAAADLDVPLTFEGLRDAGADLGHGSLVAIDERVGAEALARHFWEFAASESCGTCTPCRLGTRHGLELARRSAGERSAAGRDEMLAAMERGSLCAFGRAVPNVARSIEQVYGDGPELPRRTATTPRAEAG